MPLPLRSFNTIIINNNKKSGKTTMTLPPGLITFYSTTKSLNKSWHVLGLGYNPSISMDEIRNAAVVYFNENMKPWLDIAMNQFKPLWSFGVVDQGFTFESITSGGNLVSIDLGLVKSCSDFTRLGTVSTSTNLVFASSPPNLGFHEDSSWCS
ncbi:hypothetical protein REPUB_Repub13aG0163700 [Reevesia pubescens]